MCDKDAWMTRRSKIILATSTTVLLTLAVVTGWMWKTRGPVLKEIALNLRAGAQSRHAEKPFERFLELRYGPLTEATNREKAFLGFFDPNHIQGMHRLVKYMNEGERKTNIMATAHWVAHYRETMSDAEKAALASWVQSAEGRSNVRQASAVFRSRDVAYRSETEPVIKELLTTLAALQQETVSP